MFSGDNYEQYGQGRALLKQLSADYHSDPELRARIDGGDSGPVQAALGFDNPEEVEIRLVPNTPEVWHLPMPPDPNAAVSESQLADIAGGTTAGCVACGSTAGTFACSTAASTLGSGGTVSTASSES